MSEEANGVAQLLVLGAMGTLMIVLLPTVCRVGQ